MIMHSLKYYMKNDNKKEYKNVPDTILTEPHELEYTGKAFSNTFCCTMLWMLLMKQEQLQSKREHSREEGGLQTPCQTPSNVPWL